MVDFNWHNIEVPKNIVMMDYRSTQDEVVCLWVTVLVILTDVGRSTLKVGGTIPQAGGPRLYKDGELAEG